MLDKFFEVLNVEILKMGKTRKIILLWHCNSWQKYRWSNHKTLWKSCKKMIK